MNDRISSIELLGHTYPLCLTIEAQDQIKQLCGGVHKIDTLFDTEDVSVLADNVVKLLAILLKGGIQNAFIRDELDGTNNAKKLVLLSFEELRNVFTFADIIPCQRAVIAALTVGTSVTVEAEPAPVKGKKQAATP